MVGIVFLSYTDMYSYWSFYLQSLVVAVDRKVHGVVANQTGKAGLGNNNNTVLNYPIALLGAL